MGPRARSDGLRFSGTALLTVAIGVSACGDRPPPPTRIYDPSVVGVVSSVEEIQGGGLRVELETGESVVVPASAVELYGGLVLAGQLLIFGENGNAWRVTLSIRTDECFAIPRSATDAGSHVLFRFGLRLPKAPGFDPGLARDRRYPAGRDALLWVNAHGEAVNYGTKADEALCRGPAESMPGS